MLMIADTCGPAGPSNPMMVDTIPNFGNRVRFSIYADPHNVMCALITIHAGPPLQGLLSKLLKCVQMCNLDRSASHQSITPSLTPVPIGCPAQQVPPVLTSAPG